MSSEGWNKSSYQYPWFMESCNSQDNATAVGDMWADAQPDGTVPNNWLSVFGGPAWRWDSRRKQYYLHNFLDSQPDLNFHNPDVVDALLDTVEFWLKRGVDGFRLDTANYYYHDIELRNNPPKEEVVEGSIGVRLDNPYAYQLHVYDKSRPENIAFLKRLRSLLDQYPETTTVGEVGCDFSLETMAAYTQGNDKLHMCYSFDLLTHDNSMNHIRNTMETIEAGLGDGWPCWSIGNHDVERVATRWGNNQDAINKSKAYMAMLLTLRGSVCLYQGEELGLPEAELTFEQLVDPFGINFWPEFKGRDGCRTPLPWQDDELGGFTQSTQPWLPISTAQRPLAVSEQEKDPQSVLHAYRDFLQLRRQHPELRHGDIAFLYHDETTLTFTRHSENTHHNVAINTSNQEKTLPFYLTLSPIALPEALNAGHLKTGGVTLPAYGVFLATVTQTP